MRRADVRGIGRDRAGAAAAADVWKYQSYDREAASVRPCAPVRRSDANVEEAELRVSRREADSIVIGAGSTRIIRELRFSSRLFPVMFGSPQAGILDPLRGFVGGGARSDVFNQGLQKLNALFNIGYYLNICNI